MRRPDINSAGRSEPRGHLFVGLKTITASATRPPPGLLRRALMKLLRDSGSRLHQVDCIGDHPYRPAEIRQLAESSARQAPHRAQPFTGPTSLEHAAEVAKYAADVEELRTITGRVGVEAIRTTASEFPFGLSQGISIASRVAQHVKPGNWPDPDMLPRALSTPHPGWEAAPVPIHAG